MPGVGHGACVLLPAPSASSGGLSCVAGDADGTVSGGAVGSKGAGASFQPAADHQGRDSGDHGCRAADAGADTAGDAPC